jgi:hypothetical protein
MYESPDYNEEITGGHPLTHFNIINQPIKEAGLTNSGGRTFLSGWKRQERMPALPRMKKTGKNACPPWSENTDKNARPA